MNDEEAEWSVEQALLGRGDTLRERIAALPRLLSNPTSTIPCRICATAAIAFDVVDYHKACGADPYRFGIAGIPVTYYRCPSCCCIFTNFFDRWSPQDFKRFIYNRDYELVDPEFDGPRASRIAAELAPLLAGLETARILAYGPGAAAVAAAIAALGFARAESCDPLAEARRPAGLFDVVAGFGALERTAFPLQTFDEMRGWLSADGGIILDQTLQPANIAELRGGWRHIAPRDGHVSGFAEETLQLLADRLGFVFHSGMGRCGFLQPTAGGVVAAALARLGPIGLQLGAPAGEEEGWYGAETSHLATRFRWTRAAEITWPPRWLRARHDTDPHPLSDPDPAGFRQELPPLSRRDAAADRGDRQRHHRVGAASGRPGSAGTADDAGADIAQCGAQRTGHPAAGARHPDLGLKIAAG